MNIEKSAQSGWLVEELLVEVGLVKSKSEARRMVEQDAVRVNQEKVIPKEIVKVEAGTIIQVGKRKFVKVK